MKRELSSFPSRAFPRFESYPASPRGAAEGREPGVHNPDP
jgi:hypothetical protein